MKFIIIIYTTNKLTVVEMEDIRGVRLRKFKLRKIVLGVMMHFHHIRYSMLWPLSVNSQKYKRTVGYPSTSWASCLTFLPTDITIHLKMH